MTSTPSSGQIAISDIISAFPTIGSGSMAAYRGQTWYQPGTGNSGTFSSGQIAMSDFYNKTGTQQIPIIPYQNILVNQWGYHMGGCYGTGVNNLYVQIGSYYGITATATGWAADYGAQGSSEGNWSPNGWTPGGSVITNNTLATVSQFINTSTGFPYANFTGNGVNTYASGRDTNALRAITSWDGATFTLTIQYDCKGGGTGWGTTFFSSALPVTWQNGPY